MNKKIVNRVFAGMVFLISALQYFLTMQPSVSFWDCGEFAAASFSLQVPHPPGTPFFLILGRLFMTLPFGSNPAYRITTVSVLSSALSVLFLYLIIVKVIENYKGKGFQYNVPGSLVSNFQAISVYIISAIGALSLSFSDTFWFNGVESEIYAISAFCFSSAVWLMMIWYDRSEDPGSEKWIILTAYVIGIAIGIHLMAVLAIVPIVMMIVFKKYLHDDKFTIKSSYVLLGQIGLTLVAAIWLWAGETSTDPVSPEMYKAFDSKFATVILLVNVIYMGIFYKFVFKRDSFYIPYLFGIPILAIVFPISYEIFPKYLAAVAGQNNILGLVIFALILAAIFGGAYYFQRSKKHTLSLGFYSLFFVILGFSTFAQIIVRSNQFPPMNENEPTNFKKIVSYLNREQYGDFPTFQRRWSAEDHQRQVYTAYSSDLDFLWTYQMHHMMTRYWLWNYAGRESWEPDAGPNIAPFNGIGNIFNKMTGIKFAGETADSLFGIPFLLGLIGIFYQFRKDWKLAAVFMTMFIFMGYITAYYQNQQQPQPRERDYFYVGAFFVFSIWISYGMMFIYDLVETALTKKAKPVKNDAEPSEAGSNTADAKGAATFALSLILLAGVFFVPFRMAQANWHKHDRSGNYLPFDYAYNLLQSCEPNAILFTNGDNDTFPLWYVQDVAGVRRDIRIVNLSLGNTDWYIRQLKNNDPYKVGTVDLPFSDDEIAALQPVQFNGEQIVIPAPPKNSILSSEITKLTQQDTSLVPVDTISFFMQPTLIYPTVKAVRVQDLLVRGILKSNNWKRPIYFSMTCGEDTKIGCQQYLIQTGFAYKFVPLKQKNNANQDGMLDVALTKKMLLDENVDFSQVYKPGMRYTNLGSNKVFFDENQQRMVSQYRLMFYRLVQYYIDNKNINEAKNVLAVMKQKISNDAIPYGITDFYYLARIYSDLNSKADLEWASTSFEKEIKSRSESNPDMYGNMTRNLLSLYQYTKQWDKAIYLLEGLASPNSPDYQQILQQIEIYKRLSKGESMESIMAEQNRMRDAYMKAQQDSSKKKTK